MHVEACQLLPLSNGRASFASAVWSSSKSDPFVYLIPGFIHTPQSVHIFSMHIQSINQCALNARAQVIGRDREVGRVMQILARKRKNNPILLGEPGACPWWLQPGLERAL